MPASTPPDEQFVDACGESPGRVCEAVWEATENETLAVVADWFIGRPLRVVLILLTAWLIARLVRRSLRALIHRVMVANREAAAKALQRFGVGVPATAVQDPRREARASSISTVVASSAAVVIWVVAVFLVLGELSVDLAPLIASAGIAGLALGFGAQSLVKDCITGFFMLLEDQYGIGDVVDLGEASGSVERVSLRTTVLRGQDGTVWHVPNGEVRRVGNQSQLWSVAVVDVLVGADADVDLASRTILETAVRVAESEDHADDVLDAPELLGVEAVAVEGITVRVLVKTHPGAQFRLQRALREAITLDLAAVGIQSPPPPRAPWSADSAPPSDQP